MSEKNYQEYVYKEGTKIEVPKEVFENMVRILNEVIEDGTEVKSKEYYLFINTETKKEVKSVKKEDLESGKVIKIADTEKLFSTEPEVSYTQKAMRAINLTLSMNKIHADNVENGVAIHYTELQKTLND